MCAVAFEVRVWLAPAQLFNLLISRCRFLYVFDVTKRCVLPMLVFDNICLRGLLETA